MDDFFVVQGFDQGGHGIFSRTTNSAQVNSGIMADDYDRNMREIVARLRKTGARLLWSSTAPIGKKREPLGYQFNADAADYNKVAAKMMAEENIPAVDIYRLLEGARSASRSATRSPAMAYT